MIRSRTRWSSRRRVLVADVGMVPFATPFTLAAAVLTQDQAESRAARDDVVPLRPSKN